MITFKRKWGDPIVELLKLLSYEQRQIKSHRRHCIRLQQNPANKWFRESRALKLVLVREETIRDVIRQIHIIRNAKRGRREDGRPQFRPTEDEKRLTRAQFFAMAAMSASGQGKQEGDKFCFVIMDRSYFEKLVEITTEQYRILGGDGTAMEKWGPLGFPHD